MNEIRITLQRFCDYCLAFKGNTLRTVKWYRINVESLIRFCDAQHLPQLTRPVIEDWIIKGKLEKNWSAKTIKNHLQCVEAFLKWCVEQKYLNENPVEHIDKPKLPKRIPKHLSKEEALRLIDWARNYPYYYKAERSRAVAIIATFIYTGVRLQELKDLKMSDVDLQNKIICVREGKGKKDRIVPLNYRLIDFLKEYLKDREKDKRVCPYFFVTLRKDEKLGEVAIKRLVQKLRDKSGIYFYPHLLRHTFAVLMLQGGCDLFVLSKMMGHSSIETTTIYLTATTAHMQNEIVKHPLNC